MAGTTAVATGLYVFAPFDVLVERLEADLDDDPQERHTAIVKAVVYVRPIVVLVFLLGYLGWTIITSTLYTVATMTALGGAYTLVATDGTTRDRVAALLSNLVDACRYGALELAPITM